MKRLQVAPRTILLLFLLTGAVVFVLEHLFRSGPNGSLLLALSFWVMLAEGCIALAAAGVVTRAKWIVPIKKDLLSTHPMLLLISFLFFLLWPQMDIYPWAKDQGFWLNTNFFIIRNGLTLLVVYWLARKLTAEVLTDGPGQTLYAVLFLIVFVFSQTLVAFDWIMSLEYPWFSGLFGAYFFIEAIYCGTAIGGVFCCIIWRESAFSNPTSFEKAMKDVVTMMFGFCLLWGGFFYAQFLTIWYGNLPEEVRFFVDRLSTTPLRVLSILIMVMLLFIPFPALLSARAKTNPRVVISMAGVILSGIFIERVVFILPVVNIRVGVFLVEFLLISFLFVLICMQRDPA